MSFIATAIVVGGVGTALISKSASDKQAQAIKEAQSQYKPIDLDKLQQQAQGYAQQNIEKSIALEKQYLPDVSAARFGLQKQVAQDLARGGNLPPDVANQVTRASMAQAGSGGFGAGPLTAAQLGLSALDLRNQAQGKAAALTSNATAGLPTSGLDPGSLASAAIGQNQQQNQFNMGILGAKSNLAQSEANMQAQALGNMTSLAAFYGGGFGSKTPGTPGTLPMGSNTNPSFNLPTYSGTTFSTGITPYTGPYKKP
jgi:hypothetical protein